VVQLFNATGNVAKEIRSSGSLAQKLIKPVELSILHIVLSHPGIYLREIQSKLIEMVGVSITLLSLCRFLSHVRFSHQKMKYAALQRDEQLCSRFVMDVSIYNLDMLIFLDESGVYKRASQRKYGYSLRGKPPVCHKMVIRDERVSLIAFMSMAGVLDCHIIRATVNGDIFYDLVEKFLLPHLIPLTQMFTVWWYLITAQCITLMRL